MCLQATDGSYHKENVLNFQSNRSQKDSYNSLYTFQSIFSL